MTKITKGAFEGESNTDVLDIFQEQGLEAAEAALAKLRASAKPLKTDKAGDQDGQVVVASDADAISDALLQAPTQDNIALVVAITMSGRLLYDHTAEQWLEWDGTRWKPDETGKSFDAIRHLTRRVNRKGKSSLATSSFFHGVEAICKSDRTFAVVGSDLDQDEYLLNTPAGTVDLRTGKIRPHNPSDMITKITSASPSPVGGKRFLRFMNEVTGGDRQLIKFIQVSLGACLSGATSSHWLLFWIGDGRNGKNTLGDLVMKIMHVYAKKMPSSNLMSKKNEGHPTEIAMLKGARLVVSSEINDGDHWNESRINEFTGDAILSGRFIQGNFFDFRRTHKHLIYGNHRPQLRAVTNAIKARIKIIPFSQSFLGREETGIEDTLFGERDYVLHWLIEGHNEWLDAGRKLPPCEAVEKELKDYFESQSTVDMWLSECTRTIDGDDRSWSSCTKSSDLFGNYSNWKKSRGESPVSMVRWSETMKKHFQWKASNGVRFRGVELFGTTEIENQPFQSKNARNPCGARFSSDSPATLEGSGRVS
jgi:putative DNA primase/helicase